MAYGSNHPDESTHEYSATLGTHLVELYNLGRPISMVGQKISHYEILEELGSGGMGTVYKAKDLNLNRFVAIKFLKKELLTDSESRQRFINEAKNISSLDHPNIAVVHEIGEFDGGLFICMAFYEGQSMQQILANGPLPLEDVYSFAIQIAKGLSEAHNRGVIHRDIKPGNIIITKKSQVKILDFGLSKGIDLTVLTRQDTVLGTAAYMSPEQVQGKTLDQRTDIFSFGIMLYEMIAGERPFGGEYSAAVSYSIMHENPPSLKEIRPEISVALEKVVLKALSKDENQRYQSAAEIEADLQALQNGATVETSEPPTRPASLFKNRPAAILGSFFAVILLMAFFFMFRPGQSTSTEISIAVMPVQISSQGDGEDWKWLANTIAEMINTSLAQHSRFKVLSQQEREQMIKELGLNGSALEMSQFLQIAHKAKTEHILIASAQKTGELLTLTVQLAESKTGALTAEFMPLRGNLKQLHALVDELSEKTREQLEFDKSSDKPSRGVASLATSSLDAFRFYTEGKDAALDRRFEDGIAKLKRAINLDSTFIQPYYFLAWQYQLRGENSKAKDVLSKGKPYVINLPEYERLNYLLMEAQIDRRWKDYVVYLERMLQLKPANASLNYLYGSAQFTHFRRVDEGIAAMERAVQLDSTHSRAYMRLGYAYLAKGEPKKGLAMMKKFAQANPTDYSPLISLAEIQGLVGHYNEALTNCERILMMQPDFLDAFLNRGKAFLAQGKVSRAIKALEQYLQLATTKLFKSEGHAFIGEIFLFTREYEKALEQVNLALELHSGMEQALWLKGRILLKLGQRNAAATIVQELKRTLTAKDGLLFTWFLYHLQGELALFDQNYEAAKESFQKALNLAPVNQALYLTSLGNAYARSPDQIVEAVEAYKRALLFNPYNAETAFQLAVAYEKLHENTKALNSYRRALQIWSRADLGINEVEIANQKITALASKAQ